MRFLTLFFSFFMVFALAGTVDAQSLFGAKLPSLPAGATKQAKAQEIDETASVVEEENDEEIGTRDFVDPQEIQGEIRQTNDQLREMKRLIASAKRQKMTKEIGELAELQKTVLAFQKQLKTLKPDSENARDVLEEYRGAQLWDVFNDIRRRVELPKELADIKKSLTTVEKLMKQKQVIKAFTELGGDVASVQAIVATMRNAYDAATQAMANADVEAVDDALMDIREGGHPGELEGMIRGMQDFSRRLRMIRDKEIQDGIKDFIKPIITALNEGDIREARMTAEELGPQIDKIMQKAVRVGKKERKSFLKKIEDLERLIGERLEAQGQKGESAENGEGE